MSTLPALLDHLRVQRDFVGNVVAWERFPARPARTADAPEALDPRLLAALRARGIERLFTHQAAAIEAALAGENVVVSTSTASGKTLCFSLPVIHRLLANPQARALYLFPTKALAHDQLAETALLLNNGRLPVEVNVYDGDTPSSRRGTIRKAGGILITNPDMLHAGILPFHPSWREMLGRLEYVVLDEIHAYRGIFGSHVANVIRRLRRLCRFYGSDPQFICCSATIANPLEHAGRLVEAPFTLIDESQNGAPRGAKDFILYNPPIIDEDLGLRASTVLAAKDAAVTFLTQDIQTIVFARSRQTVELLLGYLRDDLDYSDKRGVSVAGYRGGYLPLERRDIEHGLRDGAVRGVVATNALELGIDIGQLDAAVLTGYPGTIASTWQQAGRAGRRAERSAAILVAGNGALDQYLCAHPRYLFGRTPEYALTNPDNLPILARHLLCAAFELPFEKDEPFGGFGQVQELLEALTGEGELHPARDQYHYVGEGAPAGRISLRTSGSETVVIQDDAGREPNVIGEIDQESAPMLVHEGAIYMHQAQTYLVDTLDWEGRIAHVRPVEVDYYTRALIGSTIRRLDPAAERPAHVPGMGDDLLVAQGEVTVITQATGFRKIRRYTQETLGYGEIDLPEMRLETTGYWLVFGERLVEELERRGIFLRANDYGPNWQEQRKRVLERDHFRCRTCGAAGDDFALHVHHLRPFREYGYIPGVNDNYLRANQPDNLVTLCASCHRRAEAGQQTRSALAGLAYVLRNLAPLFLMCDPTDIEVSADRANPVTRAPTLVVYERVAAGVGFSERLYELHDELLAASLELVGDCQCRSGCPACVGPPGDIGPDTKEVTRQLLEMLLAS